MTPAREASRIDGAAFVSIYRYVLLPLSIPGFVVVLIWQFTSASNDFLFAATLTSQPNWPVTVALNNLAGSFSVDWNVQMAGALIAALPTLLIYILLGKYFMRGLLADRSKADPGREHPFYNRRLSTAPAVRGKNLRINIWLAPASNGRVGGASRGEPSCR